jgi:hypothetical protein
MDFLNFGVQASIGCGIIENKNGIIGKSTNPKE